MRKFIFGIFVLMLLVAFAPVVEAANSAIRVHNDTGKTVFYLYVSRQGSSFGEDRLGSRILRNGETFGVPNLPVAHTYQVRLVDEDGNRYTIRGVTLRPAAAAQVRFTQRNRD